MVVGLPSHARPRELHRQALGCCPFWPHNPTFGPELGPLLPPTLCGGGTGGHPVPLSLPPPPGTILRLRSCPTSSLGSRWAELRGAVVFVSDM